MKLGSSRGRLGTYHCLVLARLALGCGLSGGTLFLTDLCTGQELTQLLHAAEEAKRYPSPLGGRGRQRRRPELRKQLSLGAWS